MHRQDLGKSGNNGTEGSSGTSRKRGKNGRDNPEKKSPLEKARKTMSNKYNYETQQNALDRYLDYIDEYKPQWMTRSDIKALAVLSITEKYKNERMHQLPHVHDSIVRGKGKRLAALKMLDFAHHSPFLIQGHGKKGFLLMHRWCIITGSHSEKYLAVYISEIHTIFVYDTATNKEVKRFIHNRDFFGVVRLMRFSPSGSHLAVDGIDCIHLLPIHKTAEKIDLRHEKGDTYECVWLVIDSHYVFDFTPDGKRLFATSQATSLMNSFMYVWDLDTKKRTEIQRINLHNDLFQDNIITQMQFISDSSVVCLCCSEEDDEFTALLYYNLETNALSMCEIDDRLLLDYRHIHLVTASDGKGALFAVGSNKTLLKAVFSETEKGFNEKLIFRKIRNFDVKQPNSGVPFLWSVSKEDQRALMSVHMKHGPQPLKMDVFDTKIRLVLDSIRLSWAEIPRGARSSVDEGKGIGLETRPQPQKTVDYIRSAYLSSKGKYAAVLYRRDDEPSKASFEYVLYTYELKPNQTV